MTTALSEARLVRKPKIAEICSVSVRTINVWMDGVIPFHKIKGVVLFDPDAVFAALKAYERKVGKAKSAS